MPPQWTEVRPGVFGMMIPGADGNLVILRREVWERKDVAHEHLAQNWDEVLVTITACPSVHASRRLPDVSRVYSHWFPALVHEDGRVGPETLS